MQAPKKSKHKKNTSQINQVRIVGGRFKRSNIGFVDADGLRPTPDRMREILFNWLMHDIFSIHGARVLDACAGSGVLGFECLSRGAESVTFIEDNKQQYQQLIKTAKQLKLSSTQAHIYQGKAEKLLPTLSDSAFDLVFIDPPYLLNLWQSLITGLQEHQLLKPTALIYLESDKPLRKILDENTLAGIDIIKEKSIGQVNSWLIQMNSLTI